ncbi:MAG: phosphoketolase, partial [Elusimicrobiota bacterium]
PTVLGRATDETVEALLAGNGYEPRFVEGEDPTALHQTFAATLDDCYRAIRSLQGRARAGTAADAVRWPAIVLRTPKGWTGPKVVAGDQVEGTSRAHQFRMAKMEGAARAELLESWMLSYRPRELFDAEGRLAAELTALAPKGPRRMSANPHANGGREVRDLRLPDFRSYAVKVPSPGAVDGEGTVVQSQFIRDVMLANADRFRVFSPDEAASNRWSAVFQADQSCLMGEILPTDENVSPSGRIMEVLSEQLCQGWLEGYLLTGRHGFFSCYEPFIRIVDSMFSQHVKWLDLARRIPWRRPIPSLNYLLTSHVWRQDHNGFSHMEPGFLDHVASKKGEFVRIYLPPDANTLFCVTDACLRGRHTVNVVVAGKQVAPQWLTMEQAVKHCSAGIGIWEWASTDAGAAPDVVMACCGDVPTMETLAAVELLRARSPELRVRVVNVVDLLKLRPASEDPRGLSDEEFLGLFTPDKPVIFAFHGYPALIDRLVHHRSNGRNFYVRGFKDEGMTTTPFDMVVLNEVDRWRLALDAIERAPGQASRAALFRQEVRNKIVEHRQYVAEHGEDMPEIRNWRWSSALPQRRPRRAVASAATGSSRVVS